MSKERVRRAIICTGALLVVLASALAINMVVRFGNPAYRSLYPAAQLCSSVKIGSDLVDAEKKAMELGRPESMEYHQGQFSVGGTGSSCILEVDLSTSRITRATIAKPMVMF
jgi:hypothetical protein